MTIVEPADGLLAIDIGNTRVGLGVWDSDGIHDTCRIPADRPGEWRAAMETAWKAITTPSRAVVIGSVNPAGTTRWQELVESVSGQAAVRVRDDIPLPMELDIENELDVGIDRVCCAAAAFERVGGPCAVASFGTALTVDCVSAEGRFLGGTILPGLDLCCRALHDGTAQLPRVQPGVPQTPFGKNTHDAIVGGVTYGLTGALREVVERFATDLNEWPQLVITGGNASLIAECADFVDCIVPDLCLMGIALAHRMAAGQT